MYSNFTKNLQQNLSCKGIVLDSGKGEFVVKGNIMENAMQDSTISFWAPNPPDYITSYTGSVLPFPNPDVAFENTPNRGAVQLKGGTFEFRVKYPNAFYMNMGTDYIEPTVFIKLCNSNKIHTVKLGDGYPFRMLTYPPSYPNSRKRTSPIFYSGRNELPIRTQEQILRDSAYPDKNITPKNFWGSVPPHE